MTAKPRDIDDYLRRQTPAARTALRAIRRTVRRAVPAATETIGYQMPAFLLDRVFFYFAAFQQHVGVFPPVRGSAALLRALQRYRGPKGNLRFPLAEPMPLALVARVARALAAEVGKRSAPARRRPVRRPPRRATKRWRMHRRFRRRASLAFVGQCWLRR